jgi:hypothetical protein
MTMGEVLDEVDSVEGTRHFVLPMKEELVEIVARSYSIDRLYGHEGRMRDASTSGRGRYADLLDRLAE